MAPRTGQRQGQGVRSRRRATAAIPCPDCDALNSIDAAALFEGSEIRCAGCGSGLIVARDRVEHSGSNRWILISTLIDLEEP